mmetsp:Transcript_8131/g.15734  ORF Transcript_8131/g.15734 Transcript_8131/m.15734 type:complete len:204 (-) Transcript_8131:180-791(-)|eukprot:scaffold3043_cov180-Amphora_coffeaeformis.AAC.19
MNASDTMKSTRNSAIRALTISVSVVGVALVIFVVVATGVALKNRGEDNKVSPPILPLDTSGMPTPQKVGAAAQPLESTVDNDLFSGNEDEAGGITKYQTDCFLPDTLCTAFSDECCPGSICVPVTETESRCSSFRANICINTNKICNDAVFGVECCDGGVCTPEPGNTGRSRCVLPSAVQARGVSLDSPTPTPTPRPSLRPVN